LDFDFIKTAQSQPSMNIAKFHCPKCNQQLDGTTDVAVEEIECPTCKFRFTPLVEQIVEEKQATEAVAVSEPLSWTELAKTAAASGTSLGGSSPSQAEPKSSKTDGNANIEKTLETIGGAFLAAGIIGGLLSGLAFLASFDSSFTTEERIGLFCLVVVSIAQGFIVQTLFRALAEIIRLLRKLNSK
jgi:hypothetical protein